MLKRIFLRSFAVMMSLLIFCASFASCNNNIGEATETTTDSSDIIDTETDSTSVPNTLNIVLDGKSQYTIVTPDSSDDYTISFAEEIRQFIRNKTRANVRVVSDGGKTPSNVSEYEILIGRTNRQESLEAYNRLDYNASKAFISGTKIVLAAHTPDGFSESFKALKNRMRISKDAKTLTVSELNVTRNGTYGIKKLTLGGVDFWDYGIVASGEEETAFASTLCSIIAKASGIVIDVYSNSDAIPSDKKALVIRSSENSDYSADTYYTFEETNGGFALVCPDAQGRTMAYTDFQNALVDKTADTLELSDVIKPAKNQNNGQGGIADLKIMTFNVLNGWNTSNIGTRDDLAAQKILAFEPDVLGLQEFDDYYRNATGTPLISLISEKYSEVNPTEKSWNPIFYNKTTLTLITCGHVNYSEGTVYDTYSYQGAVGSKFRTINWALFKHRESEKQFLVLNTHLDVEKTLQPSQVNQLKNEITSLQATFGVENIFLLGDLNSNINSQTAQTLFNFGFKDTHALALTKDDLDSATSQGQPITEPYSVAIDHVYCIGDNISVSEYMTIIDIRNASDHCPVCVTLKIE